MLFRSDSVSIPDKAVIELVSFHDRKRYRIKVDLPTDLEQKMRQVYLVEGRHDRRNRLYFGLAPGGYFEVMLTGGGLQLSPDLLLARGIAEVVTDDWYDQRVPIARQYGMDDFDKKYGVLMEDGPLAGLLARSVVVVDKDGNRNLAKGYLNYLYSPVGQDLAAKYNFRPRNAKAAGKYAAKFPKIKLFTIDQVFGGWAKAQKTHFANGGIYDQFTAEK